MATGTSRTLAQVLADARALRFEERASDVTGSIRFELGEDGRFRLEIDHGHLHFDESDAVADCVVTCSGDEFVRLVEGSHNMLTAMMQGRVRIDGDVWLAKFFHGVLPAGRAASDEEARP